QTVLFAANISTAHNGLERRVLTEYVQHRSISDVDPQRLTVFGQERIKRTTNRTSRKALRRTQRVLNIEQLVVGESCTQVNYVRRCLCCTVRLSHQVTLGCVVDCLVVEADEQVTEFSTGVSMLVNRLVTNINAIKLFAVVDDQTM